MEKGQAKTTLTLKPDSQSAGILPNEIPKLDSLANISQSQEADFSAGTIDESMLTEEEKQIPDLSHWEWTGCMLQWKAA